MSGSVRTPIPPHSPSGLPEAVELSAKLRELLAKATPGEWYAAGPHTLRVFGKHLITTHDITQIAEVTGEPDYEPAKANAALIVEMKNALPGLLDRIEALEKPPIYSLDKLLSHQEALDAIALDPALEEMVEAILLRVAVKRTADGAMVDDAVDATVPLAILLAEHGAKLKAAHVRIEKLQLALKDCADDLEAEIINRSPRRAGEFEIETRRRDRDLEPVHHAAALLQPASVTQAAPSQSAKAEDETQ